MLQKIIVVIVGLVMSVVGALSPEGLIAGKNAGAPGAEFAANTAEQTLATLRTSSGDAFARVSVLWVEVDGRRVTEDAWGTGEVEELRFKVGVKGVDDVALAVGDKIVPLHPTDIITVRMFRGDFSYRGVNTPLASVQLQGVVKTTVLNEGAVGNRVQTRVNELDLRQGAASRPGEEANVAYVVLTTGKRVDTVAVENGGARLYTEEVTAAASAKNEPGNLLAKWVKFDGKLIREYTWGDGTLAKVEFEPAEGASRSIVLAFNGQTFEVPAGERIVVEDFVGEYLVYQVSGGMMRVRLDGYARAYLTAPALPVPQQGGEGAPLASFEFAPPNPKTTDTVQFRDRSSDDGIIVFRSWDFGDGSSGVLPDPSKRFTRPGSYDVKLTVTDNDLKSSNITRTVVVRNSEPVADFDFSPKIVNTDTMVAFTDHSYDADGTLVNWTWEFGDGGFSYSRHPTHRFTKAGSVTVTLTTADELGGRSSISKVVLVRNAPPLASFTFSPGQPLTLDPVQFIDNSSDRDGRVVAWNWSFGDGRYGAGSAPVHVYARPGAYIVSLTVTDDMGDVDTVSTTLIVGNRPPFAEFTWSPPSPGAGEPVLFTSQSHDPDGTVLTSRWRFAGRSEAIGGVASHTFPSAGTYDVTLTVTDDTLGTSSVTRTVTIANSAPRAGMIVSPNPTYRGVEVVFSDTSSDVDGDAIVNSTWSLGDGNIAYGPVVRHTYASIAAHDVTLTVRDENGHTSSITRTVRVLNRPPIISADFAPKPARVGENITFLAQGVDPDVEGGPVQFLWNFSDGVTASGPSVTRTFATRGNYTLTVRGMDAEGGVSAPRVLSFFVDHAKPIVDFAWLPDVPLRNQLVNFTDLSTSANGAIREWRWSFGDESGSAGVTNPSHVYLRNGTFTVRLAVTDAVGQSNVTEKTLVVNLRPHPRFIAPTEMVQLQAPVTFTDQSFDEDGTIEAWSWSFGDGSTSQARHPTHSGYQAPGSYAVTLTVTDDRGTTNSTTRFVEVANAPPVAAWSHDTMGQPLAINTTVLLRGYDHSYDPDGGTIVSFNWTMGDRTPTKFGPNVTHAFKQSGRWLVGLHVFDGAKQSVRTSESHKELHVQPLHDVRIVVTASLPDNTRAPIGQSPYVVSVLVGGQPMDGGSYTYNADSIEVLVPAARWVHDDAVVVRISAPFLGSTNEWTTRMKDYTDLIEANLVLRMAVGADITPSGGTSAPPILLPFVDTEYRNDPLYSQMSERPFGRGRLSYADGSAAGNMRVDVEARWVPLFGLGDARNLSESALNLPNWCRVASATTATNGSFNWIFDGQSQCYTNAIAGGQYPAGRWEVRARPQVPTAENKVSAIRSFYVDPTGGLLLRLSMGLA
ncbi:MAG TPA: PKD domain-containing protein [Candidatus Thermoplasmatota archaeon]|nr:PKD domain-containing protein [Candidatus Thermoplasmatota archaeon]